jgi:hypothetical protein
MFLQCKNIVLGLTQHLIRLSARLGLRNPQVAAAFLANAKGRVGVRVDKRG